jgi:hypothetical protein
VYKWPINLIFNPNPRRESPIDAKIYMRLANTSTVGRILVTLGVEECVCYRLVPGEHEHSHFQKYGPS